MEEYRYLESKITQNVRDEEEIKKRIGAAKVAFDNLERVLKDRAMSLDLRLRLLACCKIRSRNLNTHEDNGKENRYF